MKFTADATIPHNSQILEKFEMQRLYACLFDYIRQNTNRTRQIAACKRTFKVRLHTTINQVDRALSERYLKNTQSMSSDDIISWQHSSLTFVINIRQNLKSVRLKVVCKLSFIQITADVTNPLHYVYGEIWNATNSINQSMNFINEGIVNAWQWNW